MSGGAHGRRGARASSDPPRRAPPSASSVRPSRTSASTRSGSGASSTSSIRIDVCPALHSVAARRRRRRADRLPRAARPTCPARLVRAEARCRSAQPGPTALEQGRARRRSPRAPAMRARISSISAASRPGRPLRRARRLRREALGAVPPAGPEQRSAPASSRAQTRLHRPSAAGDARARARRAPPPRRERPTMNRQNAARRSSSGRPRRPSRRRKVAWATSSARLRLGRPPAHRQCLTQHVVRRRAPVACRLRRERDAAPGERDLLVDATLHPEGETGEVDDRGGTIRLVLPQSSSAASSRSRARSATPIWNSTRPAIWSARALSSRSRSSSRSASASPSARVGAPDVQAASAASSVSAWRRAPSPR